MFPETAGKRLEEVEDMFALGIPAWKTKNAFNINRKLEKGELSEEKNVAVRHDSDAVTTPA